MKTHNGLVRCHPGGILKRQYLDPLGLSAGTLAQNLGVPRTRIERIVAETSGISADSAARLGRFFGTSSQFWLNLQVAWELANLPEGVVEEINNIQPIKAA